MYPWIFRIGGSDNTFSLDTGGMMENCDFCEAKIENEAIFRKQINGEWFEIAKLVSKTLKEVEKKFLFTQFFRVHNSYLINLNHVKEYLKGLGGELIMTNGLTASISRNRKAELFKKIYLD